MEKKQAITNKTVKQYIHFYGQMYRIRVFEEHANQLYMDGKMPGLTHMSSGQEAVAVGVCEALSKEDYITSTHRGHGHCLAKGASLDRMFGELLGKEMGYCRGKGGSMHIADQDNGNLGANAIVGGSAGIATGAAFSAKFLNNGKVAVCFFGDGALGQGLLYEVLNMASLWSLPVLYVCENNLYGEYTHYSEMLSGTFEGRAKAFSVPFVEVDGQDITKVYPETVKIIKSLRKGKGPAFMLCNTYRYYGHHVGDINREYYREQKEETYWKEKRDPLIILRQTLLTLQVSEKQIDNIEKDIKDEAEHALHIALNAPFPAKDEVAVHVYTT